ncbi:MAG: hypothetical protein WBS54_11355 [Acidobacteriota bacterium]
MKGTSRRKILAGMLAAFLGSLSLGPRFWGRTRPSPRSASTAGSGEEAAQKGPLPSRRVAGPLHSVKRRG